MTLHILFALCNTLFGPAVFGGEILTDQKQKLCMAAMLLPDQVEIKKEYI